MNEDRETPAQYTRAILTRYTETITVNDIGLDAPELTMRAATVPGSTEFLTTVNEGEIWEVLVTISPPAPYPFTIWVTGTQSGDILETGRYSQQQDIKTGDRQVYVRGTTVDDLIDEDDGTLTLTLRTQEGYTVDTDNDEVSYTVKDDDDAPIVSFSNSSVFSDEAIGNMRFPVRLSGISDKDVTVNYTIEGGSTAGMATLDQDYESPGTELVISAGLTMMSILIPIENGVGTSEPNESFTLKITGATNGQLEGGASELIATGTITDNDNNTALPVIRIDNPSMSEGIAGRQLTFTVSISDMFAQ